jgi:hypothetical protein
MRRGFGREIGKNSTIPLKRKPMEMLNSRDAVICAGLSHTETIVLALMTADGFLGILSSY